MQIQDKIIPDQKIAVINYKGPISDLEVLLSKLMDWVETEEIKTIGEPFIIYYSPRHSVNQGDAVFDVGIAIEGNAQAKDIIKTADLFEHGVLSGIHEGSIDNILDSYEDIGRALDKSNNDEELREGLELIYKKLTDTLKKEGLEEIPAKGEKFDPFKHEALMVENNPDYENGEIIEVLMKGYTLKDKVIRYSKVKVCKK